MLHSCTREHFCWSNQRSDLAKWILEIVLPSCSGMAHYFSRFHYSIVVCWQRSHVFQWDGKPAGKWIKVDVKVELPKDTVLEVEFVQELRGEVNLTWWTQIHYTFVSYYIRCIQSSILCTSPEIEMDSAGRKTSIKCTLWWVAGTNQGPHQIQYQASIKEICLMSAQHVLRHLLLTTLLIITFDLLEFYSNSCSTNVLFLVYCIIVFTLWCFCNCMFLIQPLGCNIINKVELSWVWCYLWAFYVSAVFPGSPFY